MTEFPGWERIQIAREFESTFNMPVYFEHDANAGAIAEWWFGPHNHEQGTLLYVAAGQGIGAGIVQDGRLIRGAQGIAGEIGHMSIDFRGPKCACGNNGCLEHYCSTLSIIRAVQGHAGRDAARYSAELTFEDILNEIDRNNQQAIDAVKDAARYLALGLVNMVNVLNPNVIIIGDDLSQAGEIVLSTVREVVKEHILPELYQDLKIELSTFTGDPVLLGISTLIIDKTFQKPSVVHTRAS
jgi:predicted NBD/HSP70 family sugar kinase